MHKLLPSEAPEQSEAWQDVMKDIADKIMPGMTHWQSPNFHAYYPTQTSYPSIVGDIIASGFGIVGFSWVKNADNYFSCWKFHEMCSVFFQICSPACTELEVIVMDWLGKFLDLPEAFLNCAEGPGGGVIQGKLIFFLTISSENIKLNFVIDFSNKKKHNLK